MPETRFRNTHVAPQTTAAHLRDLVGRTLTRSYTIDPSKIDEAARTIELAFSSEIEVERWYDEVEILDHSAGAVDLSRLNSGANLLFNHNPNDPLGVVEQARIDSDRKGRALVRFGESARAEDFWKDVKGGILRNVSVGYRIHSYVMKEKRENGQHVYLITRWEPFEVSIVTIPADTSVGVQRQITPNPTPQPSQTRSLMNRQQIIAGLRGLGVQFDENADDATLADLLSRNLPTSPPQPAPAPQPPAANRTAITAATSDERERVRQITEIGRLYNHRDLADTAITNGDTVDQFRAAVLTEVGRQRGAMADSHKGIGLSKKDVRSFSMMRLINALSDPTNKAFAREAAHELEVIEAAASASGSRRVRGVIIPADITECDLYGERRDIYGSGRRDIMSVKTGSGYTGDVGNIVQTTLLTGSFIEMLRNRTVLLGLATVLTGLEGEIDIPKQTGQAAAGWIGEDDTAPGTDVNFGLVGMKAKTVAARAQLTRKTLKQSSLGVEGLVRMDLAKATGQAIDSAGFYGDGTGNQPVGIAFSNPTGINFAAVNPTYSELVAMETALGEANIDAGSSRYVARAAFRGHAKTTQKFTGGGNTGTIWEPGGTVNGYGCEITNQINAGDVFFGDFAELVVGLWGGLDILVDPFTDSNRGRLNINVFNDVDFVVRRAAAFALGRKPA